MQEPQEIQVPSLGGEDPLEEEMATHSSFLVWKIPWSEEPGSPWDHKRVKHTEHTHIRRTKNKQKDEIDEFPTAFSGLKLSF